MNEQEVRTLLADLADTPAPPPHVDVPRAVTVARRRARVRTWMATAAAAVLVVGLAVGATYVVGGSSVPGPVATAPERFDPLIRYASFGWVPEKGRMNSSFTTVNSVRFGTGVSEYVPDPSKGPMAALPSAAVSADFYAAGVKPQSEEPLDVWGPTDGPDVDYAPVSDAPVVNGVPAYWVTVPGDPETIILKWR